MTGSSSDTAVFTAGTNGTLSIVTTDDSAAAANIQITADGTAELAGTTVTLDSGGDSRPITSSPLSVLVLSLRFSSQLFCSVSDLFL